MTTTMPERTPTALPIPAMAIAIAMAGIGELMASSDWLLLLAAIPVASIVSLRPPKGAPYVAAGAMAVGTLGPKLLRGTLNADVLAAVLAACATAALLAVLLARMRSGERRVDSRISALALAAILLIVWSSALHIVTARIDSRPSIVENFSRVPIFTSDIPDEAIHFVYVMRVADGVDYYVAVRDTLMRSNAVREGVVDLYTPLSYRPPLTYWILGALPRNGISYVLLALLVGSGAVLAAYALARQFTDTRLSLLSGAVVATLYHGVAITQVLFGAEVWAGMLGLISVTLMLLARRRASSALALMTGAATIATIAVAVRELGFAYIAVGLMATLIDRPTRQRGLWAPWVGAALVAVSVTLLHWSTATAVIHTIPGWESQPPLANSWFHADGLGLVSAAERVGALSGFMTVGAGIAMVLGCVGAAVASRTTLQRVTLMSCTLGGAILLALLHPTGSTVTDLPPAYWSDLVTPIMLACAPLAFAPLLRIRRGAPTAPPPEAT